MTQLSTFSNRGRTVEEMQIMRDHNADFCRPHADLLDDHRRAHGQRNASLEQDSPVEQSIDYPRPNDSDQPDKCGGDKPSSPVTSVETQADLVKRLMDSVTRLEDQARRLLLDHLDHGIARTLLVADRNCQCLPRIPWTSR